MNFDSNCFVAHVAGMAGKQTTRGRVNTIVGLDPAGRYYLVLKNCDKVIISISGPLFSENNPAERLASGDADYVEGECRNW